MGTALTLSAPLIAEQVGAPEFDEDQRARREAQHRQNCLVHHQINPVFENSSNERAASLSALTGALSAMAQRSIDDRLDFIFRPIPDHERGADAQSHRAKADARRDRDLSPIATP